MKEFFLKFAIPGLFFFIFAFSTSKDVSIIIAYDWVLVSEVTALSTVPQRRLHIFDQNVWLEKDIIE